jgi:Leucine-rich repeat (LRR) protein
MSGSIPLTYSCLTNMNELVLNNNMFFGSIPSNIGCLSNLQYLNIASNAITGTLLSLGSLRELKMFVASGNSLTGTIPDDIGSLVLLTYLSLEENYLTGTLPNTISYLSKLNFFFVGENQFVSTVPSGLCSAVGMSELGLNSNHICGSIPACLGSMSVLELMYLYSNELTGRVPSSLGAVSSLSYVNLRQNRLTGPIPPELGSWQKLKNLNLNSNQFSSTLPAALGSMTDLHVLYLSDNMFTGSVPDQWGSLTFLAYVFLEDNMLSGTLPALFQAAPMLLYYTLSRNSFSGSLPVAFTSPRLEYLFLESNLFEGSLPALVQLIDGLNYFDAHDNFLTGSVGTEVTVLSRLLYLDLSGNSFIGALPSLLGPVLGSFNVSHTALGGAIPPSYADTSALNSLNLSYSLVSKWLKSACLAAIPQLIASDSIIGGSIPIEFCSTAGGVSIDVSGTSLECYSGCLTTSAVLVVGASPECHDGHLMRNFLVVCGFFVAVLLVFTALYRRQVVPLTVESKLSCGGLERSPAAGVTSPLATRWVVIITLFKLVLAVVFSMGLNDWWSLGQGPERVVESCSNPVAGHCYSICQDVVTVEINITTDDYTIDDVIYASYPLVTAGRHYESDAYCIAEVQSSCAFNYWLVFKLVPIMLHLTGFLLQCFTWWFYQEFTPQQKQYDIVIAHLYPEVLSTGAGADGSTAGRELIDRGAMIRELSRNPSYGVFAFLEVVTMVYVWGELVFPPVYCGAVRPLSLYYYPVLMTMLELTKFNFYVVSVLAYSVPRRPMLAVLSLLNAEMLVSNTWVSVVIAAVFVSRAAVDLFVWLRGCCVGDSAWPELPTTNEGVTVENPMSTVKSIDGRGDGKSFPAAGTESIVPVSGSIELRDSVHG